MKMVRYVLNHIDLDLPMPFSIFDGDTGGIVHF
jgi:hypothetical protein